MRTLFQYPKDAKLPPNTKCKMCEFEWRRKIENPLKCPWCQSYNWKDGSSFPNINIDETRIDDKNKKI